MTLIKRLYSITTLPLLLGAFTALALAFMGVMTWVGYRDLEIGGPYYQRMIDGKGLIGELLPPPEYLMEAYLEATLAYKDRVEKDGPGRAVDTTVSRLKQLHQDYDRRLEFWSHRPLPPEVHRKLVEDAFLHAHVFWAAIEQELLPALQSDDMAKAKTAFANVQNAYEAHRAVANEMLRMLSRFEGQNEAEILHHETVLVTEYISAFLAVLAAVAWMMLAIRDRVAKPIVELTALTQRLARDEYPLVIPGTEREDELGQIARALSELQGAIRERAQLAEEKDRFSEVLAHHIQEPVRLQQIYADLLKSQLTGLSTEAEASLARVLEGAHRLRELISDVQTYVTLRPLPPPQHPCDVDQAFDAALAPFAEHLAALGATLERVPLGKAGIDPVRMINIFSMLIDNAIKYRHPVRPLHLRAEASSAEAGVIISVTDNGIGVAPEYRQRVFRVFERLHNDPDIPGTGIGLALVHKMVTLSKGSVWIEAGDSGGCRICLMLPAA